MSAYTRQAEGWALRIGDGRMYVTYEPLVWELRHAGSGVLLVVPAGSRFDVSIPWWATPFFSPHDHAYLKAACLHDHVLKQYQGGGAGAWDRGMAGGLFYDALRADGIGRIKAAIMAAATMIGVPS